MASLGVQALHERGFAYRDLKPDNLLLRADGYLALSDFGFACRASECGKLRVGTANYQAPEVVRKARHGKAVGVWSPHHSVELNELNGRHDSKAVGNSSSSPVSQQGCPGVVQSSLCSRRSTGGRSA
mmetsp:Transcript_7710/g.24696  ORF Transcript_7710/g.24696 Transcript_7710/m.24696 type:complete len:127 (-) Transcript_7710:57-437(-)